MRITRPLDLLDQSKGKKVLVYIKDSGMIYSGRLLAFDIHINIVLEDLEILGEDMKVYTKLGTTFIRGDTINYISPGEK